MQIQQFLHFREGGKTPADILLHHRVKLLSGNGYGPFCHPNETGVTEIQNRGEVHVPSHISKNVQIA